VNQSSTGKMSVGTCTIRTLLAGACNSGGFS
jgi:hypothetical protein